MPRTTTPIQNPLLFLLLPLMITTTSCGSCGGGGLLATKEAREKRELCESTNGIATKSYGCSQNLENASGTCEMSPLCDDAVPRGRPKSVHCECPPGHLYSNDDGCQPHPDPVCAYPDGIDGFEDHVRMIEGEEFEECGRRSTHDLIPDDMRGCMIEAQSTNTKAIAIFEYDEQVNILVLDQRGTLLDTTYSDFDRDQITHIQRWRCPNPVPTTEDDRNYASTIFLCQ